MFRRLRTSGCLRLVLAALLAGFILLNALAYLQAWNFTHFLPEGAPPPRLDRMSPPEKLWVLLTGVSIGKVQNLRTPRELQLTYEVHTIPLPQGESLEAWWIPHDASRGTVLLFHGFASSKESMLAPAAALHELGYSTFLVDFRGSGGSSRYDTTLGMREADDVTAAVAYVEQKWHPHPLILYGFSMGTAAILRAVADDGVQPDAIMLEGAFDTILNSVRNRFNLIGVPAFPASELLVFWGGVQQGYNGFALNPAEYARAVTCPTLVLHGERDPLVTNEQTLAVYVQLNGPKRFVNVPNALHELLVLKAPALWKTSVGEFLNGIH